MVGARIQRRVNREIVGAAQQVVEFDGLDIHLAHHAWIHEGIAGDHRHTQRLAPHGHGLRDVPKGEQTQREPAQPGPRVRGVANVVARQRQPLVDLPIGEAEPAVAGQQQHQGVIGHFVDTEVGHVAHGHAVARGRIQVHRVHAVGPATHGVEARARDKVFLDKFVSLHQDDGGLGKGGAANRYVVQVGMPDRAADLLDDLAMLEEHLVLRLGDEDDALGGHDGLRRAIGAASVRHRGISPWPSSAAVDGLVGVEQVDPGAAGP